MITRMSEDTSNDESIALALAEAEQQRAADYNNSGSAAAVRHNHFAYPGTRSSSSANNNNSGEGGSGIPRGRIVSGGGGSSNNFYPPPGAAQAGYNAIVPPNNNNFFQQPPPQMRMAARRRIRSHMCHVPALLGSGTNVCVEMMVDTGAESSVISLQLARELRLDSQIDRTQQGIAAGVGRARIVGKIHDVVATFGHVEFTMEFMVLEVPDRLLILGMDQMRKYNCIIDLQRDILVFGGAGGVEVPMLPPDKAPTYDARVGELCAIS